MLQKIRNYLKSDIYPFHMPGHKRNPGFLPSDMPFWDITEIPGMDNLHAPDGIIRDLQQYLATIYKAEESFLLVNGSSSGICAAICAASNENESIHIARNAHKSVFNALVLSGAMPVYVQPDYFPDGLVGGVNPSAFACAKVAFITSPSYEGFVPDVQAIADMVHAGGGILIVDEAHGAHFPFHHDFPPHALTQGADIVINSLHKTLPMLSQTAVLHVQGPRIDRERLRFFLQAMQTTSPSYMLMGLVDYYLSSLTRDRFDEYIFNLNTITKSLPSVHDNAPIRLCGGERAGKCGILHTDPGKLLFALHTDLTEEILVCGYKIQPEVFTASHFLAMTSVADTLEGFARLQHTIEDINKKFPLLDIKKIMPTPLPEVALSPREAMRCRAKVVSRAQAIGRIAGEMVVPYPPGIPVLAPGEQITEELLHLLPPYVKIVIK